MSPSLWASCRGLLLAAAGLGLMGGAADAQTVVVQQPVVQQFGVHTAGSVPDRGSLLLGSVSSSRTWSRSPGPSLPSSLSVRSSEHSAASVHVFIHDFDAMDQAVLAAAGVPTSARRTPMPLSSPESHGGSRFTGMAAHAQQSLLQRHTEAASRRNSDLPRRR
ncbi:MAG: hypothetical protein AB7U20_14085 [Planctomycetaceae bacterium]